jgi:hypothetical protein
LGLIRVLKDFRRKNIAFIFPFFLAFIGASSYTVGDAERYRDQFYQFHDTQLSWDRFRTLLLDGETSFDVAVPTITYFVASFTRDKKVLFSVFGLILGYFYGRNIQFLLDKLDKKKTDKFVLILIFTFSLFVSFWDGIRGVRMWTAAHIYFYGVSRILVNKELKYWPFLVLACAYHFSFLYASIIFLGYLLLPKRNLLFPAFCFFIISNFVDFNFTKNIVLTYTPVFFETQTEGYTSDEYIEAVSDESFDFSWHFKYSGIAIKLIVVFLLILAYYRTGKDLHLQHPYYRYYLFGLIFFGFANFIAVLPVGDRFIRVALMFSIIPICHGYISAKRKKIFYVSIIPLLFWLIVTIRESFYSLTIGSFLGNPFTIFLDFMTDKNLDSLIK